MGENYNGLRQAIICLLFITASMAFGQTGVKIAATAGPADASAILELSATNKGLLFPRVDLVSLTNNTSPVNNPATGLVVYNTGNGGVSATGIYFWSGSAWVLLSSGGLSGSGTINQVPKFTATNAIGNSTITDIGTGVGINQTSPAAKLEVDGSSGSTLKIVDGNQAAGKILTSDATGQASWKVNAGPPAISTVVSFAYTGADQTWTVPGGVTSIQIDLYGAAGGNGSWGGWNYGWTGGPGGYTHATLAVTPGQVLTIIVGQGGAGGATSNSTNSYGGGGHNCTNSDCQYAAKGGGRSAIRNSSGTELLTAGGGGGGGSCVSIGNSYRMCGGAGGGLIGNNSINEYSGQVATGGTQSAGGTGMPGNVRTGTNGAQYTGGSPGGAESYGGGGGGGWYGGGGGNYYTNAMGGGAGGSGYISGAGVTNAWTQTGGGAQPEGGVSMGSSNWPYFGRNGSVIISY